MTYTKMINIQELKTLAEAVAEPRRYTKGSEAYTVDASGVADDALFLLKERTEVKVKLQLLVDEWKDIAQTYRETAREAVGSAYHENLATASEHERHAKDLLEIIQFMDKHETTDETHGY